MMLAFCRAGVRTARPMAVRTMATVRYSKHGDPRAVLEVGDDDDVSSLGPNEVAIRFRAAPINPADFNMVEGTYGLAPSLPAVGGNEGVASVTAVGDKVSGLSTGDWVIPATAGFGTWRSVAKCNASAVHKVPNDIPVEAAATLAVSPCTALRMLTDFVDLSPGDVVVQNGANSSVGQAVIQLAKARGLQTVNIIRDRPNSERVIAHLKDLGGDVVVTDGHINTPEFMRMVEQMAPAKLGLNCTGGKAATNVARCLGQGATMVTYGGMARKGVEVPTSTMIFNDLTLRGFWMSRWVDEHSAEERAAMIDELCGHVRAGNLNLLLEKHPFADFAGAVAAAKQPFRERKVLLSME
mmetsp:Transcript_12320/g.24453  ORF Transcript_12320/g.24453 Transcript_12320/m.24453 type:complete len:353 (-) Transcript_12320:18-1076(-)